MAKRQKTKVFSFQGFDNAHYKTTAAYTRAVNALFDKATNDIADAASKEDYNPDKPFSFDDYPKAKARLQTTLKGLAKKMQAVIELGSRKQWLFACQKNDEFIASIFDTTKLTKGRLKKMQDRNLDALQTFQQRKVGGMNLSERVWKYTEQYKDQIEIGLDVGLGEGCSAQQLSRDLRQNLQDPNRLFRRVRDKRGNLHLSKAAKAFHPGTGVYRSSYKNAMRLTRSEINMAYREADYLRWQQLDFVVGFEIHRSNHEPQFKCKLCDRLVGKYPKTFKFKGWHPQCMCYATAILMDEEDFDNQELSDLKSALRGTAYKKLSAKNEVTDLPDGFKEWVKENAPKQAGWATTPYFIRDNFVDGQLSKGLRYVLTEAPQKIDPIQQELDALQGVIAEARKVCAEWGISPSVIDSAVQARNPKGVKSAILALSNKVNGLMDSLSAYLKEAMAVKAEADSAGVDFTAVIADIQAVKADKRKWFLDKDFILNNLQNLKNKIKGFIPKTTADTTPPNDVEDDLSVGNVVIMKPKKVSISYIADDKKLSFEERATNIMDGLRALFGSDENTPLGYDGWWNSLKVSYGLLKGQNKPLALDGRIITPFNKQSKDGLLDQLNAINHWAELSKVTDLAKIPMKWRTLFNEYVQKIGTMDIGTVGYTTVYREIEAAYNIYKLSTSPMAVKYGLGKLSPKMPYQLFEELNKKLKIDITKTMPLKGFFDSLEEFVPLSTVGASGDTCYFSPTFKHVRIPLNIKSTKERLIESDLYRTKILYHEFGHARDYLTKGTWRNNKAWKDLFDKFKDAVNKDNGKALEAALRAKATALGGMSRMTRNDVEQLGAYADTLQSLVDGHRYVWNFGHSVSYWKGDKMLAEFIAHASENYWGGNELFKELYPDLYREMCKLMKSMCK